MESYFRLAEQFRTQDDPSFCGLSSLTMVLNALAVDPGRTWKGEIHMASQKHLRRWELGVSRASYVTRGTFGPQSSSLPTGKSENCVVVLYT